MTDKRHPTYLLMNGNLVAYDDARVHVLSTAFKYGATVFEGLRAYWSEEKQELYGFRLREHFQRLVESLRICRMGSPLTVEEYTAARPAFKNRYLVALARVTASSYGTPAPGYAEACRLMKA